MPAGTSWLDLAPDGPQFRPFHLHTPQAGLDHLRAGLAGAGWSDQRAGTGLPIERLRELAEYWHTGFDWRAVESRINKFSQFTADLDGTSIHFVHVRSPEPDALPLVLTQDWPDSFVAFLDVIAPLTDPRAHGADPSLACHLVIPSLPGCGLSGPAGGPGWQPSQVVEAWTELTSRLGYHRPLTVLVTGPPGPATGPAGVTGSPVGQLARIVAGLVGGLGAGSVLDVPALDRDLVLAAATVNWLAGATDPTWPSGGDFTGLADAASWTVHDRAGRFAAIQDPERFVTEVRQLFAGQHVRAGRVAASSSQPADRRSLDAAVGT